MFLEADHGGQEDYGSGNGLPILACQEQQFRNRLKSGRVHGRSSSTTLTESSYAELRYRIVPYIYSWAHKSGETGIPTV